MPAKPLSSEQQADAARLRGAWEAFKLRTPGVTQEWLADQCGWKTQAAVNQYFSARIALNLAALLKFAAVLEVSPDQISPSLAGQLPSSGRSEKAMTTPGRSRLQKVLEGFDDEELLSIAKALEVLQKPKVSAEHKPRGRSPKRTR